MTELIDETLHELITQIADGKYADIAADVRSQAIIQYIFRIFNTIPIIRWGINIP